MGKLTKDVTKNVTKHRDINPVNPKAIQKRFNSSESLSAIEKKRVKTILMYKPVYLGFAILEINIILMHEFLYNYVRPKYKEESKLCYMDTDNFIIYVKTEGISVDTWDYELDRSLPRGQNSWINERWIGSKNNADVCSIETKTYSYLIGNGYENKKSKDTEKCLIKKN